METEDASRAGGPHRYRAILHYPGGKARHAAFIASFFPTSEAMFSPFFGGGAAELHAASDPALRVTMVHGNDVEPTLACFWSCMASRTRIRRVEELVSTYVPVDRGAFDRAKQTLLKWRAERPADRRRAGMRKLAEVASAYFVANRASFNGGTLSAGFSEANARRLDALSPTTFEKALKLKITNLDYRQFLRSVVPPNGFLFVDPPYDIARKTLYGHNGDAHRAFDQAELRDALRAHARWVLCSNDTPEIRALYRGCVTISYASGAELLILSPAYARELERRGHEALARASRKRRRQVTGISRSPKEKGPLLGRKESKGP